jgi:hypothetical protein
MVGICKNPTTDPSEGVGNLVEAGMRVGGGVREVVERARLFATLCSNALCRAVCA